MMPKALFIFSFKGRRMTRIRTKIMTRIKGKNMAKSVGKRILAVLCVLAIIVLGLCFGNRLTVNKASREQYEQFFMTEQDFDVLFLGSSHVINGVSPIDLFREYGITSFNLSMHGNYVASGYYLLRESLEILKRKGRQLPKAVVLDIYGGDETVFDLHNAWDSFPLSPAKVEMVKALVPKEDQAAMLAPFFLYHNRWSELEQKDFKLYTSRKYGVQPRYEMCYPAEEVIRDPEEMEEADEEKLRYVDRVYELCESQGIQLILIHIPYTYHPEWQREANAVCQYAREQGIRCENFLNQDIGIDFEIDFYDQGHLNAAGMGIMTRELGRILHEVGMEDHRGQPQEQVWREESEQFLLYRIQQLEMVRDGKAYLMGIHDPDLISTVQITEAALEDGQIAKLVERLGKAGHEICVERESIRIHQEAGSVKEYDIYCQVYRRDSLDEPVHTAGFRLDVTFQ